MAKHSASDLAHEKKHKRALQKLGVRAETYYDNKGLYTVQTGGRRLTKIEEGAVLLAAGGHSGSETGLHGKDLAEARKLARKLRGWF